MAKTEKTPSTPVEIAVAFVKGRKAGKSLKEIQDELVGVTNLRQKIEGFIKLGASIDQNLLPKVTKRLKKEDIATLNAELAKLTKEKAVA